MKALPRIGLAVCLVSLALASSLAGVSARGWDDFTPRDPSSRQPGRWEWAWDGGDGLGIGLSGAKVRYVRNGPARIVITGPEDVLARVRVGQGQIRWCEDCRSGKGLDVTVSGVALRSVALSGSNGDIQLGRLDQDRLNMAISGTGRIVAGGRIDRLDLSISGSGDADLADATVQRANINIAGSGNARVTPRDEANIHVAGSGNVRMAAAPARLRQFVTGSGGARIAEGRDQ